MCHFQKGIIFYKNSSENKDVSLKFRKCPVLSALVREFLK